LPIARKEMIIDAAHFLTPWQRRLSLGLTALGWCVWLYLWLPGLAALLRWITGYSLPVHETSAARLAQSLMVLEQYVLVALLLGAILVLWSRINYWRFQGAERRSFITDAAPDEVARVAELPLAELHHGLQGQVLVVHHHEDGEISGVEVQRFLASSHAPVVSVASQAGASPPLLQS
jgi:biofilm PGA synthesis protein PgaD